MTTQEAKNIRIADYLQSLGYTSIKQQGNSLWYKSPLRGKGRLFQGEHRTQQVV